MRCPFGGYRDSVLVPLMGNDKKKQGSRKGVATNIYLNIYDLTPINNYLYWFGLGIFHSGIEVHGMEYGYGAHDFPSSGVFEVEPRVCPGFQFRQSVRIGATNMPQPDFQDFIQDMASRYHGNSYHLISKNCNHFTEEVAMHLTGRPIPAWVNRLARLGSLFHCLLPDGIQVSQVRHIPSQNRRTSSDGSDSPVSSILDDEDDLLMMTPRLSNFSSSSSNTSSSNSNGNSNSKEHSKSDSNSNAVSNSNSSATSNSNSNSHLRLHTHSNSHSHLHSHSHSHSHSNSNVNVNSKEHSKSGSNSNAIPNSNSNAISNSNSNVISNSNSNSYPCLHTHCLSHSHLHSYSNSNGNANSNAKLKEHSKSDSNPNAIPKSNSNSNAIPKSNSNSNAIPNSNSNSHPLLHTHSISHSHLHLYSQSHSNLNAPSRSHSRTHSGSIFIYRDRESPKLAKDLLYGRGDALTKGKGAMYAR